MTDDDEEEEEEEVVNNTKHTKKRCGLMFGLFFSNSWICCIWSYMSCEQAGYLYSGR
jgi:hypothetical protein